MAWYANKNINKIKRKNVWIPVNVANTLFLQVVFSLALTLPPSNSFQMRAQLLVIRDRKPHGGRTSLTNTTLPALHPSLVVLSVGDRGFCILSSGPRTVSRHPVHPPAPRMLCTRHTVRVRQLALSPPLKAYEGCVKVTSTPPELHSPQHQPAHDVLLTLWPTSYYLPY